MKREELSKLLGDKVLVGVDLVLIGANDGHLGPDGVHVPTQGNPMLLRLVPIGVKPCGKRINLVTEGLSRVGGDLRVAVYRVARTGYGCWGIIVGLHIKLVQTTELRLG